MKSFVQFLVVFLFIGITSCSQKTAPVETKAEPYAGPAISYATDVSPIIERSCSPCHFPSKGGKKQALDNYDMLKKELADVLKRVQMKEGSLRFMPYKMKKQSLSTEEIEMLKNWARGGFDA